MQVILQGHQALIKDHMQIIFHHKRKAMPSTQGGCAPHSTQPSQQPSFRSRFERQWGSAVQMQLFSYVFILDKVDLDDTVFKQIGYNQPSYQQPKLAHWLHIHKLLETNSTHIPKFIEREKSSAGQAS